MTAGTKRVTVYAKSTVVASTPVRPGRTYPLSALDHTMGRHTVHLVLYFLPSPAMTRDGLKESLSEVLSNYPAVTGRLGRGGDDGGWIVKCNDAGVRMMDAKASTTLDNWFATANDEEEMELVYWEEMGADPTFWSPFYVQITEFSDHALSVGLTCPHMHSDPNSALLLVRAWADAHRRMCITYPPFFHPPAFLPRTNPNPNSKVLAQKSKYSTTNTSTNTSLSSATFSFSAASVSAFLEEFPEETTPFAALVALFWSRITAISGRPLGPGSSLDVGVDIRKRMHAPLPHGFYGNAFYFTRVSADLSAGARDVAGAVGRHVAELSEDEFWDAVDWVHEWRRTSPEPFLVYGPELTCLAMDHVLVYGTAFDKDGGGRPSLVSVHIGGVEGDGLIVVMPAEEEGGRVVSVTLPEEVAGKLCRDDAILKYGPTVRFAPKSVRAVKS